MESIRAEENSVGTMKFFYLRQDFILPGVVFIGFTVFSIKVVVFDIIQEI